MHACNGRSASGVMRLSRKARPPGSVASEGELGGEGGQVRCMGRVTIGENPAAEVVV